MRSRESVLVAVALVALTSGCSAEPATPTLSALHGVLFINEFMASNKATYADEFGGYADWVELYNSADSAIHLRPMFLTDDLTLPMKWSFPDTVIPGHGYLVVWADAAYRQGALHASFKLDADSGEQLGLYVTDGERLYVVDSLTFGPQPTDTSFGRLPDGGSQWGLLWAATPGAPNSSGESPLKGTLFINEFMASNHVTVTDESGDYDDWIELYNAGTEPVALESCYLTDDLANPRRWPFPGVSLPAGGYLLVWADDEPEEGQFHATFSLGAAVGEQLGLFQSSGRNTLVVDTLTFGRQGADTSFGRVPDGSDTWRSITAPTPGRSNSGRSRSSRIQQEP